MAGINRNDLVSALRSKLSDDRTSVQAFSIAVTANAKSALLEISGGFFNVTVEQGEAVDSIRFNLTDPRYETVGRLMNEIAKRRGYTVSPDLTMHSDHPSTDLRVDGVQNIAPKSGSYTLKHHIWSENELFNFLMEAAAVHNPNYTNVTSVPRNEQPFVLMKAQAAAYRTLAADSVRRKGLDTDAHALMRLAQDIESQYRKDTERLHRVIPVPKADESKMSTGDVIQGTLVRRSLRAGYTSPHLVANKLQPPHIYDAADDDVEDTILRVRWAQQREQRFAYMELWRDTQPSVERCISGKLNQQGFGEGEPFLSAGTQYAKAGTSKQTLGIHTGAHLTSPTFDGFFFWTAAELAGASVTMATFIDGVIPNNPAGGVSVSLGEPLEPDTDYYYRVYAIDWNGEIVPSEVKRFRTKNMRCRFSRLPNGGLDRNSISPQQGPYTGGTAFVVRGTNFVTGTRLTLGGKECSIVLNSSTQITATAPAFANPEFVGKVVDLVLQHPNGLRDIAIRGWTLQ